MSGDQLRVDTMGRAMALVRTMSFGFKEADGDVFKEDQWVRFNDGKVTQHD